MPNATDRARALDILCSDELSELVELVVWCSAPGVYEARAVDGHVRIERRTEAGRARYDSTVVSGRDILADQDPTRFTPLEDELAHPQPSRLENSYPYAFEHIAQVFDHPCAPDLCVLHTAAHCWETHRGEHGSLGAVQARAPFIVAGAGVRRDGLVDRHCRLVDVAPTILHFLGVPTGRGIGPDGIEVDDLYLGRQDGSVVTGLLDPDLEPPQRVVGFLLDGANANVLHDAAACGDAPNLARLIESGTAFRHGAFASLPTVTLANHTSILTGCHPGHHGVLHNAWYDRQLERQVVTESPTTWQEAMEWLLPGVETIHGALKRARPEAVSISVNEPADCGADYSTFALFRAGEAYKLMPDLTAGAPAHTTEEFYSASPSYQFASLADTVSTAQATAIWSGRHLDVDYGLPTFMWMTTSLTDAAFHEGGPHSEMGRAALRDTDGRIGEVLEAIEKAGAGDDTAYFVVADHGMEQNTGAVTGDWGDALKAAGITFRDEASGFVYLGVEPTSL